MADDGDDPLDLRDLEAFAAGLRYVAHQEIRRLVIVFGAALTHEVEKRMTKIIAALPPPPAARRKKNGAPAAEPPVELDPAIWKKIQ